MVAYSGAPGDAGTPPPEWPELSRISGRAGLTLVMFAHSKCPYTRASLGELERLMARSSDQVAAQVWFIKPKSVMEDWARSDLWRIASAIPSVTVREDVEEAEARRFHSETSGDIVLYDQRGRLIFHGGITLARGHAGDNPGRSAITAWLREPTSSQIKTPVFGCSLFAADCLEKDAECKK